MRQVIWAPHQSKDKSRLNFSGTAHPVHATENAIVIRVHESNPRSKTINTHCRIAKEYRIPLFLGEKGEGTKLQS